MSLWIGIECHVWITSYCVKFSLLGKFYWVEISRYSVIFPGPQPHSLLAPQIDLNCKCNDFLVAHFFLKFEHWSSAKTVKRLWDIITISYTGTKGVIWNLQVWVVLNKTQFWRTDKALCALTPLWAQVSCVFKSTDDKSIFHFTKSLVCNMSEKEPKTFDQFKKRVFIPNRAKAIAFHKGIIGYCLHMYCHWI